MTATHSDAYDELLSSNAWSKQYDLPLVPMHTNPHIYTAYAVRILESYPQENGDSLISGARTIRSQYSRMFLPYCEVQPGLITTLPGSTEASHDDVEGAAFLDEGLAKRCVRYLSEHDGTYSTRGDPESKNDYRFLYFLPVLKAFARFRVGIASQIIFSVALLMNLWFTPVGDTDGMLLLWLAFPRMRSYPISSAFIDLWSSAWVKKGMTPKRIFQTYNLKECAWFGEWARDDWQ